MSQMGDGSVDVAINKRNPSEVDEAHSQDGRNLDAQTRNTIKYDSDVDLTEVSGRVRDKVRSLRQRQKQQEGQLKKYHQEMEEMQALIRQYQFYD